MNIAVEIMKARRWDVEKMSKKFGVHVSTVYRWRLGRLPPKGMAKHMLEMEYAKIEKKRVSAKPLQGDEMLNLKQMAMLPTQLGTYSNHERDPFPGGKDE